MKLTILIFSILLTGCAMSPERLSTYNPEPVSAYLKELLAAEPSATTSPNTSAFIPGSVNYAPSPSGGIRSSSLTVTSSGNYVVIPNYSSGGVPAAIIRSGR